MRIQDRYFYLLLLLMMLFCFQTVSRAEELKWGNAEDEQGQIYVYYDHCKYEYKNESILFLVEGEEDDSLYQLPDAISFSYNRTDKDANGREYSHLVVRTVPVKGITISRKLKGTYLITAQSQITVIDVSKLYNAASDMLHFEIQKREGLNIELDHYVKGIEKLFTIYFRSVQYQRLRSYCSRYYTNGTVPEYQFFQGDIEYITNGGDNPPDQPAAYVIGQQTALKDPLRKDHVFLGWYTTPDFQNQSRMDYIPDSQEGKVTLYAKWEYSVKLARDGVQYLIGADHSASVQPGEYSGHIVIAEQISYNGTDYPVTSIAAGAFAGSGITMLTLPGSIRMIGDAAFTGCDLFTDLYLDSMTMTLGEAFPKTVNLHAYADSAAYQSYAAEGYTGNLIPYSSKVQYLLGGGINHPDNPEQYYWNSYLVLQEAQREGYVFAGWYLDASFQRSSRIQVIHEERYHDVVLYAKWVPIPGRVPEAGITTTEETASHSQEEADGGFGTGEPWTDGKQPAQEENKDSQTGTKDTAATGQAGGVTTTETDSRVNQHELKTAEIKSESQYEKPVIASYVIKKTKKNRISVKAALINASGCQVKYSLSKKFKGRKTITSKLKKKQMTITKLKKGKTYYVKLRAYRKVGKKVIYGTWSIVSKIKL